MIVKIGMLRVINESKELKLWMKKSITVAQK